jgi:SpoVK/Ycf46/Vps4 family AAA+-type ATPase
VAGYVGQTSTNTNKLIDSAIGGVLFIDEAYTLAKKQNSFGQEAIDTLLKRMEDDRGKFIVIAAGYSKEMEDFLESNPGLDSRFTKKINFEDYRPEELQSIMLSMFLNEGLKIEETADTKLSAWLRQIYTNKDDRFANGRTVRNEFEKIIQVQSKRLVRLRKNGEPFDPMLLTEADIPGETADLSGDSIDKLMEELNNLTGLGSVKSEIARQINFLEAEKIRSAAGGKKLNINLHFVFTGNPGTGKTTVARILAKIFKGLGILSKGQLIEVTDKDLVAGYVGQTSANTNKVIDSAMGGVLFIDEAYTLAKKQNSFGQEAIDTLLKRMEDDRGKFIVIAAGYSKEMEDFLNSNPGLDSRFTRKIDFEDYTPEELRKIMLGMISKDGLRIDEEADEKVTQMLKDICINKNNRFANGRTVRNEFEKILQNQSTRLVELNKKGEPFDPMLILSYDIQ